MGGWGLGGDEGMVGYSINFIIITKNMQVSNRGLVKKHIGSGGLDGPDEKIAGPPAGSKKPQDTGLYGAVA